MERTRASANAPIFWSIIGTVVTVDVITKLWAERALVPRHQPHSVWGEWVRLTLVYNPGAAFGLHLGPYSRWIFLVLTAVVLTALWRLYRETRDRDNLRTGALALVSGGAVGNAIDRLRSADGVVDFIDIGTGAIRWPTFNLADVAVSVGAFLLAWVLWDDQRAPEAVPGASPIAPAPATAEPAEAP